MRERDKERSNGHASATSSPSPGIPYSRPLSSSSIEGRIRSGDSSRAPSPNGTSSSHTQTAHSGHQTQNNSHSHLAHSVRMAFGMTPIHPPAGPSSHATSHPHHLTSSTTTTSPSASLIGKLSLGSQYPHPPLSANSHSSAAHSAHNSPLHSPSLRPGSPSSVSNGTGFGFGFSSRGPSRPTSRPGSPPIILAPLRLPPSTADDLGERNIPGIQEATDVGSREAVPVRSSSADDVEMDNVEAEKDAMQVDRSESNVEGRMARVKSDPVDAPGSAKQAPSSAVVAEATKPIASPPRVVHPAPSINVDLDMDANRIPLSPQVQAMVA